VVPGHGRRTRRANGPPPRRGQAATGSPCGNAAHRQHACLVVHVSSPLAAQPGNRAHARDGCAHFGRHGALRSADAGRKVPLRAGARAKPTPAGEPLHRVADKGSRDAVPLLAYTEESGMGRIVRAVLGRRLETGSAHVVFTAHLASALRSMALDGRGVAWLPRTLVDEDLHLGRLVPAAASDWSVDLEIRLYRQKEPAGNAAEAVWAASVAQPPSCDEPGMVV
jgi:hypothetical protein